MREIKFRGWDKELNFMINIKRYKIDFNGQVLFDNNDKELYNQTNKIELMQYTGLKDKNGVEIYEGDIILWYGGALKHIPIYSEVKWNREEARFSFGCKANSAYMFYNTEVVGNIYANQDLLKD